MWPTLQNDTFLRACLRQPTDHTPLWLMRQAGRYLPEYKATRVKAGNSFMGLATNVAYATEVTLQPLDRFPLDAAILFSDILTVPDAMGLGLSFGAGEGPRFAHPVRDEAAVAALAVPDLDKLRYVFDAVTSIRRALNGRVPLIGFSGSPWTLACYMVEGAGSDDYRLVKTLLYSRPDLMHRILEVNAAAVTAYLNAQIDAGAQAVMVFDSWGGVLADGAFQRFSLDYTRRVVAGLQREKDGQRIPCIVFTKGGGPWLEEIDREPGPRAATRGRPRGAAGQPRPERAVRARRGRGPRSHGRARQLRSPAAARRPLGRPHLQPGPRHQPAHRSAARGHPGGGRAPAFPGTALGPLSAALPPAGTPAGRVGVSEHSGLDLSPKNVLHCSSVGLTPEARRIRCRYVSSP
jgi:uroporphyrinogen decarboxylase